MRQRLAAVFLFFLSVSAAGTTEAAVLCTDTTALPNPLYIQSGDTQEPLLKALGKKLRESAVRPMTLVYITSGSCTNIEAIRNNIPITVNAKYIPSAAQDPTWTPNSPSPTCTMPPGGVPVDVGISALLTTACDPSAPPSGIGEFLGPVQAYLFVVPEASSQKAITAREAYFTFGFGARGQALPWVDEAFMFIRTVTKSTQVALAANIGVPPEKWKGVGFDKSTEVLNAVSTSTSPEKTIGILGSEIYDSGSNRDVLNALAFRAHGQTHAYYADSTSTSFDKRNVRDGHYMPWSPTVYMTKVDGAGRPTSSDAAYFIDLVLGKSVSPAPAFNPLDVVIEKGLVPDCAMKVSRSLEGGELRRYKPAEDCSCYFEGKKGGTSCASCGGATGCATGVCRRGLCEAN